MSRRFGLVDTLLFVAVLAAAAGARTWYLGTHADGGSSDGPIQVQDTLPPLPLAAGTAMNGQSPPTELDALLHNLQVHQSFESLAPFAAEEEKTAHVAPGYTWLRAWMQAIPGLPAPYDRTLRWAQCGLGSLTAGLYFLFALSAFGSRGVALLTGLLCAVHPFWVVNTAELNDGVLATFLLAAVLFLGVEGHRSGGALTSLLFGLALAGLALVRAALLPFAVAALVAFLLRCRAVKGGWFPALLTFLGFVTGLAPWTLRNIQVFGEAVPLVTSTHLHLWMGNHPGASGGPRSEQEMLAALARAWEQTPAETADYLAALPQPARYRELGRAAFDEMRTNWAGTLERRLWAGLCFLLGEDFLHDRQPYRARADAELPFFAPAGFYAVLLLMAGGGLLGWRWSYAWRHVSIPSSLALVWVPLPYVLTHGPALSGPRLPLDGLLLCYAALALGCLVPPLGRRLLAGPPPTVDEAESAAQPAEAPAVPDSPGPFAA